MGDTQRSQTISTQIKLGEKTPSITLSQIRVLMEIVLPVRRYNKRSLIELIFWVQKKNHSAYFSHRKTKNRKWLWRYINYVVGLICSFVSFMRSK
jgi:hypothetical protein